MTGREIIDMILDNNWLNADFYFNDMGNGYLPVDENYISSYFNDEIDAKYYKGVKNPPEIIIFES